MSTSEAVKLKTPSQVKKGPLEGAWNLPNLLTLGRILLIPVFILLFAEPTASRSLLAAIIFSIAALTDWLDGYLARRRGEVTTLGRLLDPIADKLLVVAGLVMLVQYQRVGVWVAIVMIAREIGITGIRAIAAAEGIIVSAGDLGKTKVVLQITGIIMLVLYGALNIPFLDLLILGNGILYMALLFSLVSGGKYLVEITQKLHRA
jgi:CDP-diacylglycerol--glycerol-3-phosphate 3-phosphatidyltransferase